MFNKQRYAFSKREKRTNRDKLNSINATTNNAQLKRNNCKDSLLVRQTSPTKKSPNLFDHLVFQEDGANIF